MAIWGYSELDSLLVKNPLGHNGFLVDTNWPTELKNSPFFIGYNQIQSDIAYGYPFN